MFFNRMAMKQIIKYVFSGLLLLLFTSALAQMDSSLPKMKSVTWSSRTRSWEPAKIIGLYTTSIALNAIGDGLIDDGSNGWGYICNASSVGILLASPFIINYDKKKWYLYLISYTSLRISLFDNIYNVTRGLSYRNCGDDNTWNSIFGRLPPLHHKVSFIFGISIPINELK